MRAVPDLPSPVELGFPDKFQSWYPDQIKAIDLVALSKSRFNALVMPTGSGKSVTGIAAALLKLKSNQRAIYLTSTKGLQDQLASDFAELGLVDVRGQRNYPCTAMQPGHELAYLRKGLGTGCDEGPCHSGVFCRLKPVRGDGARPDCLSYGAVWDARKAPLVSTNYAMWFAANEYAEGFGQFDMLILDEAHDADKELESFLSFDVTFDDVTRTCVSKWLDAKEIQPWRAWADYHREKLQEKIEELEIHPPKDAEAVRQLRTLKRVFGKLDRLASLTPESWILDHEATRARFAPMNVSAYAEEHLFRGIPNVLLMSATMTRKTTKLLGIPADKLTIWECPHRFPVENRRIISVNTAPSVRVDMRMTADDSYMWLRRIDSIIEPRRELNRKGIIHTVSYQRAKELMAKSEHRDLFIVHDSGDTQEQIKLFKELDGPWILVSPSVVTGYDFPDDQCRYQIIGKVPIPDMRGPIMQVRKELDPDYSGYLAMQKLVQACGRPVRGPQDWAETFVVDDHFGDWFLRKYRAHAPKWFHEAIEYVDTFPTPMFPGR